jgi:hypothetical protein
VSLHGETLIHSRFPRRTRRERPFHSDAWVMLAGRMHCIITLPVGDDDFSKRVKAMKIRLVRAIPATERRSRTTDRQGRAGHLATPLLGACHPRQRYWSAKGSALAPRQVMHGRGAGRFTEWR